MDCELGGLPRELACRRLIPKILPGTESILHQLYQWRETLYHHGIALNAWAARNLSTKS